MGPSGCGKTTLLDILAHRRTNPKFKIQGDILINDLKPSLSVVRKSSSYVEQEREAIPPTTVTTRQANVPKLIYLGRKSDRESYFLGNPLLCC